MLTLTLLVSRKHLVCLYEFYIEGRLWILKVCFIFAECTRRLDLRHGFCLKDSEDAQYLSVLLADIGFPACASIAEMAV